jgi:hypothetical protein
MINSSVRERRDTAAATAFLREALECTAVRPPTVTTDTYRPIYLRSKQPRQKQNIAAGRWSNRASNAIISISRDASVGCGSPAAAVCPGDRSGTCLPSHPARGFSRLGLPTGDPYIRHSPRLARAWDELTTCLGAA